MSPESLQFAALAQRVTRLEHAVVFSLVAIAILFAFRRRTP